MALQGGELKDLHLFALLKKKRLRGDLMTVCIYLHGEKRAGIAGSVIYRGEYPQMGGWKQEQVKSNWKLIAFIV